MPPSSGGQSYLVQASKYEQKFRWLDAEALYRNMLSRYSRSDFSSRMKILEQVGRCQFNAAMQCPDKTLFRRKIQQALAGYKHASSAARRWRNEPGHFYYCRGMASYLQFWLDRLPREKKQSLRVAWENAKTAMKCFQKSGDHCAYAQTFNDLSTSAALATYYEREFEPRAKRPREAVERGRLAIRGLSPRGDKVELTRALVKTALILDDFPESVAGPAQQKECDREASGYWKTAYTKARSVALAELARPPRGFNRIFDETKGLEICAEALELAEDSRDNFSIGWVLNSMAGRLFWKAEMTVDYGESIRIAKESLTTAEKCAQSYDRIGFVSPNDGILWVNSPYAEHFLELSWFEPDPGKRRNLLEKALHSTPDLLRAAEKSGVPEIEHYAHHVTSKCNTELAELESDDKKRFELLNAALEHRKRAWEIIRRFESPIHWNQGVSLRYLSDILVNLSLLKQNSARRRLLKQAVRHKLKGIETCTTFVQSLERSGNHLLRASLAKYYVEYGDVLVRLYEATADVDVLRRAAQAYVSATEWYENTSVHGGQTIAYWKAGRAYEKLRAHSIASENFALASKAARASSKNSQPPMQSFWEDFSVYLSAWKKIEEARHSHTRLEFDDASRHYREAASLHRSTRNWDFLAPYYSAWAEMESAENLSKNGRSAEAVDRFRYASKLFGESKGLFRDHLNFIWMSDEKAMVAGLVNAPREEICAARVLLEEARSAELLGDYSMGSEKFGLAAEKLKQVETRSQSSSDRDEAMLLLTLSRAWESSTRAEIDDSKELLSKACEAFEEGRKYCHDSHTARLVSAHVEFCKGLLSSRTFSKNLDSRAIDEATKHFGVAANSYLESGFTPASQNATARRLLLTAYAEIDRGNRSKAASKKSEAYTSAEALLREARDAFESSRQPERAKQVGALLGMTRAQWERASNLSDISRTVSYGSANVAFRSPVHGREESVGLERLDRAEVHLKVTEPPRGSSGPDLARFEIQIVNPGRRSLRVVRIDDAVPDGAELVAGPASLRELGRSLVPVAELKIGPQKGETIMFELRQQEHCLLTLAPTLILVDEKGVQQPRALEPCVVAFSPILRFLGSAYASDSVQRQLAQPFCGWRSLSETVKAARVPKSYVYGEPRYGRAFGKQLDGLIEGSLVESRVFLGERGRGGEVTKLRVVYENTSVKRYVDSLARNE